MVLVEKITVKLGRLDEYLSLLRKIADTPIDSFLNDKLIIGSAKYYLQVSIECCLDVANHIIATSRFRAPVDYADTFRVLQENNVIPSELAIKLQRMAKFRNRLVHMYGEVDDEQVFSIIGKDIDDIEIYQSEVLKRYCNSKPPGTGPDNVPDQSG